MKYLTVKSHIIPDLPDDGPVISGTQPMYNKGDILTANCTSFNSFPAATLNWYINGLEVKIYVYESIQYIGMYFLCYYM